eukprot:237018-Rhodomonas_salina.3
MAVMLTFLAVAGMCSVCRAGELRYLLRACYAKRRTNIATTYYAPAVGSPVLTWCMLLPDCEDWDGFGRLCRSVGNRYAEEEEEEEEGNAVVHSWAVHSWAGQKVHSWADQKGTWAPERGTASSLELRGAREEAEEEEEDEDEEEDGGGGGGLVATVGIEGSLPDLLWLHVIEHVAEEVAFPRDVRTEGAFAAIRCLSECCYVIPSGTERAYAANRRARRA